MITRILQPHFGESIGRISRSVSYRRADSLYPFRYADDSLPALEFMRFCPHQVFIAERDVQYSPGYYRSRRVINEIPYRGTPQ